MEKRRRLDRRGLTPPPDSSVEQHPTLPRVAALAVLACVLASTLVVVARGGIVGSTAAWLPVVAGALVAAMNIVIARMARGTAVLAAQSAADNRATAELNREIALLNRDTAKLNHASAIAKQRDLMRAAPADRVALDPAAESPRLVDE
jgi:hypothetical protein